MDKPSLMDNFERFTNLLATRGGAIFCLLLIVGSINIAAFIMYLRHDISAENLKDICAGSAFTGALLLAFKGSSDSTATVSGPSGSASASTSAVTSETAGKTQ